MASRTAEIALPRKHSLVTGGVVVLRVIRPETDIPHRMKKVGFSHTLSAISHKVLFHGRILCELGKYTNKDYVFPNAVPGSYVEVTHALTCAVCARMGLARTSSDPLRRGPEKGKPFQPSYTASREDTTRRQR